MKNLLCAFIMTILPFLSLYSQDVIVKRDGSTIISKVLEVNPESVKYKMISNIEGPIYNINISEIFSINYANGEKELFNPNNESQSMTLNTHDEAENSLINDGIISDYNDRGVKCNLTKFFKNIEWVYRHINVHTQSNIGNKEARLYVEIIQENENYNDRKAFLKLTIENTSDKIMYVDLGKSSLRTNDFASIFFVNKSTTTSEGHSSGVGLNLGAVASAFGFGGIAGTLASGVSVGGENSSGTSTTYYAERIATVPAHSKYNFTLMTFYNPILEEPYKTNFKFGDVFHYNEPESLKDCPWEISISYLNEVDLNTVKKLNIGMYITEEISVSKKWGECIINESGRAPIHYFYKVK